MKNYVKNRRFVIYPYSINNAQLERVIICFSELVGSQLTVKYQENYHSTIFSDGIILYKCVAINHQNQTMININYAIEYEFGLSFGKLKKYHSTLNDLLIAVWKGENIEEKTNEILATRANNFWAKSEFSGFRLLQKLVFYPLLCIFIIGPIVMAVVYQKLIFLLISLFFIFMFWPYIKTEIYVIRKKWKMNREKRLK
ncbi:MAG: hypothetical protein H6607_06475 [Flavobacteriales bacterium]|nr:hypothetical protein [Flavobacteriales bacterium]